MITTIEEAIKTLAGCKNIEIFDQLTIKKEDVDILESFTTQLVKGTAFTDRQNELAINKICTYRDQLEALNFDVDCIIKTNELPVRVLDRAKWIKIERYDGQSYIVVRFVFNKRLIAKIDKIKKQATNTMKKMYSFLHNDDYYDYYREDRKHSFTLNELSIFNVVEAFKHSDFEIDDEVWELYNIVKDYNEYPEKYIPGVFNYEIKNLHQTGKESLVEQFGNPCPSNIVLYNDRSMLYGLYPSLDQADETNFSTLAVKIANRTQPIINVPNTRYSIEELFKALHDLRRNRLLILIDENLPEQSGNQAKAACEELTKYYKPEEISILFRFSNQDNEDFNNYVKVEGYNSPLSDNTKIVLILRNKVPKPLIKSNWKFDAVVKLGGFLIISKTRTLVEQTDLIVEYSKLRNSLYNMPAEEIT